MIKPDGEEIELKVVEHDVPYLMEYRETTAVPANIDHSESMLKPAATFASQSTADYRAARDSKLRSILKSAGGSGKT